MKRFWVVGVLVASMTTLTSQAVAEGDAAKGEKLFKGFLRCNNCHSLEPGVTKVGPTLAGIIARKAGSVKGFNQYSEAMVNSGIVWDKETLNEFFSGPQEYIPWNGMIEGGRIGGYVSSDRHRADLIAYLIKASTQ